MIHHNILGYPMSQTVENMRVNGDMGLGWAKSHKISQNFQLPVRVES